MQRCSLLLVLGAIAAWAPSAGAEGFSLESEVAVVSDYRWRGVSYSEESAALQGEASLSHGSGAWLWGWASSTGSDLGGSELGLGAGLTREIASIEWSVGALRYLYPGEDDFDYTEFDLSAARSFGAATLTLGAEYVPEQHNYDEADLYTFAALELAAHERVTLFGHVGQDDGSFAPAPYAVDYSVGARTALGPMTLEASYVDVETEDGTLVLRLAYAR